MDNQQANFSVPYQQGNAAMYYTHELLIRGFNPSQIFQLYGMGKMRGLKSADGFDVDIPLAEALYMRRKEGMQPDDVIHALQKENLEAKKMSFFKKAVAGGLPIALCLSAVASGVPTLLNIDSHFSGRYNLSDNYQLGVEQGALDGVGLEDGVQPPFPPFGAILSHFSLVDGDQLYSDVRSPLSNGETKIWHTDLYGRGNNGEPLSGKITLIWSGLDQFPQYSFMLEHVGHGTINMRNQSMYEFSVFGDNYINDLDFIVTNQKVIPAPTSALLVAIGLAALYKRRESLK